MESEAVASLLTFGRWRIDEGTVGDAKGSVRALMSLAVVLAAAGVMAALLAREPESDLTQVVVGGWIAALGNVIEFYLGTRAGERARDGLGVVPTDVV